MLQEEDPTKYEAHFAKYIEAGIDAEKMEDHILVSDADSSRVLCDVYPGHVHRGSRKDP